jgi:hypothetical protein
MVPPAMIARKDHVALLPLAAFSAICVFSTGCSSNKSTARTVQSDAPPAEAAPSVQPAADAGPGDGVPGDASARADAGPLAGADFEPEARVLYRVAACGGEDPTPERIDAKLIEAHCKDLKSKYEEYRSQWMSVAMPYLAALVPKGLPPESVYPFGGGDLMTALATFPDASVYTTISLEIAGDVRKIDTITMKKLADELALNRLHLGKLFEKVHSRTVNLDLESKSDLPGEIVFSMVGLALYGYEPVSLRYFKFKPDGTIHYLDQSDIDTAEKDAAAKKKRPSDVEADLFGDMELQFRKAGDATLPVKVLRHVAYNLDDKHMRADPSLLKHLEAKGKITAMTKAASHFLWSDDFSVIRQYLLDHMEWMISDSTGIPPKYANKAGFLQDTYGIMEWPAAFGPVDNKNAEDLRRLFKSNPQKDLPFRYGYPDRDHHGHMMITRKPNVAP